MIKNRAFLIVIFVFLFNFCFINKVTAIEDNSTVEIKNSYPDYSYEFVGKDSWENFNRKIFAFNLKANKYVIRPINIAWASIMPQYGIDRVNSFYTNAKYPIRLMGCLCQKDFEASRQETKRFLTNSTLGVAGLYDVAQSKYKIEPREEDMEQALAYHNVKRGPYLVLPIVAQGNVRDIGGQVLDLPLNPTSYIVGPIALVSTGVSWVNGSTYMQPLAKMLDNYADPYEITKQLYGIERYIKNTNLDRKSVYQEKTAFSPPARISHKSYDSNSELQADVILKDYNSQGPEVDAIRTMLFDSQNFNDSIWSELSVWNKDFNKRIKTTSVNITPAHPNYNYRYILQKDKTAPLAILYPSIGEGVTSNQSKVFAKMLYDEGYSVVIIGSPFQWEFVKSMPDNYRPGLPNQDAKYLIITTSKILNDIQNKKSFKPNKKILVGTSFGGLTTLFVAAQDENDNQLGISNYISINTPIEIFYALKQIDKYCNNWQKNITDLKLSTAITAKKVIEVAQTKYDKDSTTKPVSLPFTEDEAQLAISFAMKLKLYDLVYTIENNSRKNVSSKNNDLYKTINNMSFYDYAQKYLISEQDQSVEKLSYDSSLYSLANFLRENKKYKIYETLDDCFVNKDQLTWLKKQTGNKAIYFSNGSHLGSLYRKEFIDEFKKEIRLEKTEL